MNDSIPYQVQQPLLLNQTAFDREELASRALIHSSYSSLRAITGSLNHSDIDCLDTEVLVTLEIVKQRLNDLFGTV